MKKYISLSWCLLLVLGLASCDTDDDYLETKNIGGYASLVDSNISIFDTDENLSIEFFTAEGVTAESVEILQDGEVIGSGTVSGETATFNTSILGDLEVDSYPIRVRTTYSNGNVSEDSFSVSVDNAIALGDDNPTETNMDDLADTTLEYELSTFNASVDEVTLLLKKNEDGTYADSGVTLSSESGSVDLSETNYAELDFEEGDTLYYNFVASSGTMTDEAEGTLVINPKAFEVSNSVTLSSEETMDNLNLATGDITAEDGEIAYLDPAGFEVVNDADISFVQLSDDYFDDLSMDVINAREAFMAGTTETSFTNLSMGDLFAYEVTREVEDEDGNMETVTLYGILEITSVTTTDVDGVQTTSLEISYSEGS
jgi:hypothetical protein